MTNDELLDLLSIFKQSREKITNDFIVVNEEIYRPMFEFENDNELMGLAIDKYFTSYVNYHFEILRDFDDINAEFIEAMLVFLRSLNVKVTNNSLSTGKDFFLFIIQKKEKLLEEIINMGRLDNKRYNALAYSYLKDKTLFDREINKIKRDKK